MKYIRIKIVDAVPMTADVAGKKGHRVGSYKCDGYEVTDTDGYKSWCPKDVFEKHNYAIKNEELAKTCELMVSPDYKERFKAEYIQLKNRFVGLGRMLDAWQDGKLTFVPPCLRDLYCNQWMAMGQYLDVLKRRSEIEGIKLDD